MAFNILDAVRGLINPDIISKAASYTGESDASIGRALNGLIPASLLGITQKVESGGGQAILDAGRQAFSSGILGNLSNAFRAGGEGIPDFAPGLLSSVLGDKVGGIANAIAQYAGIKGSSAASLIGSIVPLILGLLGKFSSENNLNVSGLQQMLAGQKTSFMNALPPGLNLPGFAREAGRTVAEAERRAVHETPAPSPRTGKWLMPLLLGIAAIALLLYLVKGCGGDHEVVTSGPAVTAPDTVTRDTAAAMTAMPARESLKVTLADGTEIDAYRGGIEDELVKCLNDATCTAGKDRWFDFDNINFEVGSAQLTAESDKQVRNIAAILKAYPSLKIKIGGYTDKTGDAAANKKLSQDRADAVLQAIKNAGGNAAQLAGAEGYGSEFAKVPAEASDEERRVDRRISVQVREK